MFKRKQQHKNKEQIIAEAEQKQNTERMRVKVKDEFYPFLIKNSESIRDAQLVCEALSIAINQAFENQRKDKKVCEMKLIDMMPESKNKQRFTELLTLFENEKLPDALTMIDGMKNVIDSFIKEETTTRKLDTLKATFL